MPRILSIQVGRPQTLGDPAARDPLDQPWTTSFFKQPVSGPVQLSFTNIEGDEQADRRFHGDVDKAVLCYSGEHFPQWRDVAGIDPTGGGFGENLTVEGITEEDVCIGDIWGISQTRVQVSQPRQPCFKLGRRWRKPELVKLVALSGWTGWYLRVLQPGVLTPGEEFQLVERVHAEWTVARANKALFQKSFPVSEAKELASLPELADAWKEDLLGRIGTRVEG